MNHGLKIMEDGTLVVTLPKDKAVKRVLVDYSGTQNGTLMYPDENAMAYDEFLKTMDMAIEATTGNDAYSIGMRNGIRYAKSVVDNVDPEYESVNEEKRMKHCSSAGTIAKKLHPDSPYVFYDADHGFCINTEDAIEILSSAEPEPVNSLTKSDMISKQKVRYKLTALVNEIEEIFAHIREREVNDCVCGLCEYDGTYIGQSGDWCNECPGFEKDNCFKLKDKYRDEWESIDE